MILREGAHASYIGYEENEVQVGDRCLILSSERTHSHVKWVTGSAKGQYDWVSNDELVVDRPPARFDDEFTFETYSNRIVNTACREVRERKGDDALLKAIRQEGHLDSALLAARQAVEVLRSALAMDEAWEEVQDDLGAQGALEFEKFAVRHLIGHAVDEVIGDGVSQPPSE